MDKKENPKNMRPVMSTFYIIGTIVVVVVKVEKLVVLGSHSSLRQVKQ
jgi:hypothetical protein